MVQHCGQQVRPCIDFPCDVQAVPHVCSLHPSVAASRDGVGSNQQNKTASDQSEWLRIAPAASLTAEPI